MQERSLSPVASPDADGAQGSAAWIPRAEAVRAYMRAEAKQLLVVRLRLGVRIVLFASLLFTCVNLALFGLEIPALPLLSAIQVGGALLMDWVLRRPDAADRAAVVGLCAVTGFFATVAGMGVLIHDDAAAPLGLILLTLGAATLLPWSLSHHLLTVVVAAIAIAWNVVSVSGSLLPFGYTAAVTAATGFVAALWIASQQERWRFAAALQELERQRDQQHTAALQAVAKDISRTPSRVELLNRVQRRTASVLPCDMVGTFYWDTERAVFRTIGHYGVPADLATVVEGLEFPPGAPFGGRLQTSSRVVIDRTTAEDWVPTALLAQLGIAVLVAVPLIVGERWLGTVVAARSTPGTPFDEGQLQLFEGIARQLAVAIEAADLYHLQQEEVEVASALAMAGQELIRCTVVAELIRRLCRVTTAVVGCDCSHTWLWEPKLEAFVPAASFGDTPEQWQAMQRIRLSRSLVSAAFANRDVNELARPPLAHELSQLAAAGCGLTAGICAVLRRGGEILGVQSAGFRGRHEPLSEQQRRIAQGIARLAAPALERALLTEELERANRLKSEFVAIMSHELRTPLNVLIGYDELLAEGQFGPLTAAQADTLRRMHATASDLLDVINRTLDLSRLEVGRQPLELSEVSVTDLLSELEAQTRAWRDKPGVRFAWRAAPELPRLYTDVAKVKLVLKNLIENALKFTDEGDVTVTAAARDGGVEFCVTDTGVGMAPEVLPMIFEPFRQAEGATTSRRGGVGLGLYIASRLADMVGGRLSVESQPRRGSTFRLFLPQGLQQA